MASSHPDANLHPVATGSAKAIVDAHQTPQDIVLYSGWFCPFVQRTWSLLEHHSLPYQYVEVNPYHKPQSLLSLNPRGLVPTLEFQGKALYESTVICEFIDELVGEGKLQSKNGGALTRQDGYERARQKIWMRFVEGRIIPAFHRFLQWQPPSNGEKGGIEDVRDEFRGTLKELVKEGDVNGPFWGGKEVGMVDFVVAPWLLRLWVFPHFKSTPAFPEEGQGGTDEKLWTRLRAWIKALEDTPSIAATMSDKEHYLPIYQRYADDVAQSELAKATRGGRGVP